jgi:uncharacterized membrane protein YkoI
MNAISKISLLFIALSALAGSAFAKKDQKASGITVRWKEIPAVAQTTIQTNAAGGKVREVEKATANGGLVYCAEVKGTDGKWTKVYVTDAGALLKVEPDKARNKRKHKPLFGD